MKPLNDQALVIQVVDQEDHQYFTLDVVSDDSVNMVRRTVIKIPRAS